MAIQNVSDPLVLLQTAGDTYNGSSADQTYILNPNAIQAGDTITIVDQGGSNSIELPSGLTITSSLVVGTQAVLTLSSGAVIDIRGADTFTYKVGQNVLGGDTTGADLNYADFAQDVLGVTLDGGNLVEGGQVTVDDAGGGGLPVLPTVSLTPTNGETTEGDFGTRVVTFTATLSNASSNQVAVDYTTAGISAKSEIDFMASAGTLVFAPGTTEQTFDVRIIGDSKGEGDETFRVELSNPQNAELDQSGGEIKAFEALHTIIDDDDLGGFVYDQTISFNSQTGALLSISLQRFPVPDFDGDGVFEVGDSGVTTTYAGTTEFNGGTYPVFIPFNPDPSAIPRYNVYYDGPYIDPDSANFSFGILTAEPFIFG